MTVWSDLFVFGLSRLLCGDLRLPEASHLMGQRQRQHISMVQNPPVKLHYTGSCLVGILITAYITVITSPILISG